MKEEQEGNAQCIEVITTQLEHAAITQNTQEAILSSHTSRIIWWEQEIKCSQTELRSL